MTTPARARWVLHADLDAFYASVEQRDRPELRGLPVIVGGGEGRGVVAAASYEARRFGVRSAMPGFRARALCPDGVFLPPDMPRYAAVSRQVHAVFGEFTDVIEPLALDEAFLDVSGSVALFGGPEALLHELRSRVRSRVDLAITAAIAPNKLVAKLACTLAKPDGARVVRAHEVAALLAPLPVRRLWGVGPVMEERLVAHGLDTFDRLGRASEQLLEIVAGERGRELAARARGEDDRPVVSERAPKSIGEENTFERDVHDRDTVVAALSTHADGAARRLRACDLRARTVTLKVKLARASGRRTPRLGGDAEPVYPLLSRSRTLKRATDDGEQLRRVAIELWDALDLREPVRLLGVGVSGLEPSQGGQLDLFAPREDRRRRALGAALDGLRTRFGEAAVRRGVETTRKLGPSVRGK